MKLKVLIDNNTLIDRYFIGEPGVCYYIESEGKKILFDLGYSDAFIKNGIKMQVDFNDVDYVVLSHSHLDHTWGMEPLIKWFNEVKMEGKQYKKPILVAHPQVFTPRSFNGDDEFGMTLSRDLVLKYVEDGLTSGPFWMTEHLVFLGQIPRLNGFEAKEPIGKIRGEHSLKGNEGELIDDYSLDDSALCFKSQEGLVIITGCSHAGICNIAEYAKQVCGDDRIVDIVGGLHLQNPSLDQLEGTAAYLKDQHCQGVHACHCTDLASKIALSQVTNILEVGVGLELEYEPLEGLSLK